MNLYWVDSVRTHTFIACVLHWFNRKLELYWTCIELIQWHNDLLLSWLNIQLSSLECGHDPEQASSATHIFIYIYIHMYIYLYWYIPIYIHSQLYLCAYICLFIPMCGAQVHAHDCTFIAGGQCQPRIGTTGSTSCATWSSSCGNIATHLDNCGRRPCGVWAFRNSCIEHWAQEGWEWGEQVHPAWLQTGWLSRRLIEQEVHACIVYVTNMYIYTHIYVYISVWMYRHVHIYIYIYIHIWCSIESFWYELIMFICMYYITSLWTCWCNDV